MRFGGDAAVRSKPHFPLSSHDWTSMRSVLLVLSPMISVSLQDELTMAGSVMFGVEQFRKLI